MAILFLYLVTLLHIRKCEDSCAYPESFVRGGPTLTFFLVDEGRKDPNTTKSGPSLARQQNAIKMAFRWQAGDGLRLNNGCFVIFQGVRNSSAKKPYIFVTFQGGGLDPLSPNLDPRMRLMTSSLMKKRIKLLNNKDCTVTGSC